MPLVRIDLQKGKDANYRQKAGQVVYEAMVGTTGVPHNDQFQIIGEHSADNFIFDPDYLGIHRTGNLMIVRIFFNEGRTTDVQSAFVTGQGSVSAERTPHPARTSHSRCKA